MTYYLRQEDIYVDLTLSLRQMYNSFEFAVHIRYLCLRSKDEYEKNTLNFSFNSLVFISTNIKNRTLHILYQNFVTRWQAV